MSLYMETAQTGMGVAQLLLTGENAKTKKMYNKAYKAMSDRRNAANRMHTAQLNISSIQQDKVTSNTQVRMMQDEAEAAAKVSAAAAGVSGQSYRDVLYDTERSEAFAISSNEKEAANRSESMLARVGNAKSTLLTVDEPEVSLIGDLFSSLSSVTGEDLKTGKVVDENIMSGLSKLWGG